MLIIRDRARAIHNHHLPYRASGVPFPPASVAFFAFLMALQEANSISGDMLELGVQHGGTAFLTIAALGPAERQILIDLNRTAAFDEKFGRLPEHVRDRVSFYQMRGREAREAVARELRAARFVHIDAGHQKSDVIADFEDYNAFVAPDGVLCFDDVFEIRWPGVTEAVIELLPRSDFAPLALVDRKLYCCRVSQHEMYKDMLLRSIDDIGVFGSVRSWTETFLGHATLAIKIAPLFAVAREPL